MKEPTDRQETMYDAYKEHNLPHRKGKKGPQKTSQQLSQMSRKLADTAGQTNLYRQERSIGKHEIKERKRQSFKEKALNKFR